MASLAILALLAGAALQTAPGAAPDAPRRLVEIALDDLPRSVPHAGRSILVRFPDDPDVRARGGSGGPIIEFVVTPPEGGTPVVFNGQAFGIAVVESPSAWPAFELWSGAGGGTYTRAIFTWHASAGMYCAVRVDEFEDHGDETMASDRVRMAGRGRIVRYATSRPWGCEAW